MSVHITSFLVNSCWELIATTWLSDWLSCHLVMNSAGLPVAQHDNPILSKGPSCAALGQPVGGCCFTSMLLVRKLRLAEADGLLGCTAGNELVRVTACCLLFVLLVISRTCFLPTKPSPSCTLCHCSVDTVAVCASLRKAGLLLQEPCTSLLHS